MGSKKYSDENLISLDGKFSFKKLKVSDEIKFSKKPKLFTQLKKKHLMQKFSFKNILQKVLQGKKLFSFCDMNVKYIELDLPFLIKRRLNIENDENFSKCVKN